MDIKRIKETPAGLCFALLASVFLSALTSGITVLLVYGFWLLSGFVVAGGWFFLPDGVTCRVWAGLGLILYILFLKPVTEMYTDMLESEST